MSSSILDRYIASVCTGTSFMVHNIKASTWCVSKLIINGEEVKFKYLTMDKPPVIKTVEMIPLESIETFDIEISEKDSKKDGRCIMCTLHLEEDFCVSIQSTPKHVRGYKADSNMVFIRPL